MRKWVLYIAWGMKNGSVSKEGNLMPLYIKICSIPAKDALTESNHVEISDKLKFIDIQLTSTLKRFLVLKIMKDKNSSRSKETKNILQLNAICDSRLDPGIGK